MDDHYQRGRLLARLKLSYADRRNTLTWALFDLVLHGRRIRTFSALQRHHAALSRCCRGLVRHSPHPKDVSSGNRLSVWDRIPAMPPAHNKATIISMAIVATGITVLLHEGVGHGVTSWLRGGVPVELTSNHLSSLHEDRWVEAGGTLVNLAAGTLALLATHATGTRASLRYFCWLLAAHNLFSGTGYFMFSGIFGFGDWEQVIAGLPYQALLRTTMSLVGLGLYALVAWLLAIAIRPFCATRAEYNVIGRLPYLASSSVALPESSIRWASSCFWNPPSRPRLADPRACSGLMG